MHLSTGGSYSSLVYCSLNMLLRAFCVGGIMSIFLFLQQNNSSLALLTKVREQVLLYRTTTSLSIL